MSMRPQSGPSTIGMRVGQDVVLHHLRGLLVAEAGVGGGQHHVLAGGGGEAEFAMGVLADLPALEMAGLVEHVEAAERADPILAEAEIVAAAALDDAIGVGLAPQPLVDAERRTSTRRCRSSMFSTGSMRTGASTKSSSKRSCQRSSRRDGLRHGPGLVDVDADQAFGADAVAQRLEHGLLALLVDAGLDVVGAIAALARRPAPGARSPSGVPHSM